MMGITPVALQNRRFRRVGPPFYKNGDAKQSRTYYFREEVVEFLEKSFVRHEPDTHEDVEAAYDRL